VVEEKLDSWGVKPIVAVIPDNQDPELIIDEPDSNFWKKVKTWQANGWTIGMHGYQHLYVTNHGGLVVRHNKKSEFAGLSIQEQRDKIRKAWSIFLQSGIKPEVWVAPSHTFDDNTLKALESETEINKISDGFATNIYYEKGFYWVPTNMSKFNRYPVGIQTICLHPNNMNEKDFSKLDRNLKLNGNHYINLKKLNFERRKRGCLDKCTEIFFFTRSNIVKDIWVFKKRVLRNL
jgi:hypothetical protein